MKNAARDFFRVFKRPEIWMPAMILAAGTLLLNSTELDLKIVNYFYIAPAADLGIGQRFPLAQLQPWKFLYDWGELPAWIVGCGGLAVWLASFCWRKLERWRDPGLFFALLLLIGPGILVNAVCKPFWSRPRPHATASFGGQSAYLPVWQRGHDKEDSSFPSGHAAMGFYLMVPAFVCYRRRPRLAALFMTVGLLSGLAIGLARIVAGGHFPSDVLWSAGIVYFTALLLAAPFRFTASRTTLPAPTP